jgi:hypothetical protein
VALVALGWPGWLSTQLLHPGTHARLCRSGAQQRMKTKGRGGWQHEYGDAQGSTRGRGHTIHHFGGGAGG